MLPTIRLVKESDAGPMLSIYAPIVRDTAISFELEPPAEEEFRQRIRTTLEQTPWLVCEDGGQVLGYAYAGKFRTREAYQWSVEVTVYVGQDHHRRGVGRALYTALLECLRVQGYYRAVAVISLPNPASVALHERLGFERVGVFEGVGYKGGRWHDVGWWQLALQACSPTPSPPVKVKDALGTAGWEEALRLGNVALAR